MTTQEQMTDEQIINAAKAVDSNTITLLTTDQHGHAQPTYCARQFARALLQADSAAPVEQQEVVPTSLELWAYSDDDEYMGSTLDEYAKARGLVIGDSFDVTEQWSRERSFEIIGGGPTADNPKAEFVFKALDDAAPVIAQQAAVPEAAPVAQHELTVWYGPMPESNGKSNFTAILMRKGGDFCDCLTIARSEYPDRVRYEADRVRYLIGELDERPFILDYDADKHSGYAAAVPPASEDAKDALKQLRDAVFTVCEGWTLPHDARKLLETAMWSEAVSTAVAAQRSKQ